MLVLESKIYFFITIKVILSHYLIVTQSHIHVEVDFQSQSLPRLELF